MASLCSETRELIRERDESLSKSPLVRVKLPRGEVFAQLLASGLDEPGVLKDPLNLLSGGVAANVLFLEHLPEVRPVLYTVDDVLKYLILSPGSVVGAEEPIPEGSSFLGHFRCQPPFPFLMTKGHVTPRACCTHRGRI